MANRYDPDRFAPVSEYGRPMFLTDLADQHVPRLTLRPRGHKKSITIFPQCLRFEKVDAMLLQVYHALVWITAAAP